MDRRLQAWAPRLLHELERCQFEGKDQLNNVKRKGMERKGLKCTFAPDLSCLFEIVTVPTPPVPKRGGL